MNYANEISLHASEKYGLAPARSPIICTTRGPIVNLATRVSGVISAFGESLARYRSSPVWTDVAGEAKLSNGAPRSAPLRILKVTQSYYPFLDTGGPAVKVRALAQGLAERGHSVTVLTSDLGITGDAEPAGGISKTEYGWRCDDGPVETLYLAARGRYRSFSLNPAAFRFCATRLKSFDVVHIYGTYDLLGPIVARACRKKRIPYLIEPMGMFRPIVRNLALKRVYRQMFGDRLVQHAARVIATSIQERLELIEEGVVPAKIAVRRNGVASLALPERGSFRHQWKISEGAFVVLFLGRIVEKKSPDLLLEAFWRWRRSSSRKDDSFLVFAGPFENAAFRRILEEHVGRTDLNGAVLFTGPLYGDAKWSAFVDADVFVLPSRNENFGNAAAEAVACGTPVIVTDTCGIAPVIDGRAGLVVPHECEALVGALRQVADPHTLQSLKIGCLEVARGLGWEQPVAEMEALYADLLGRLVASLHPQPSISNTVGPGIREES
jgi:glycosyltransferase involved in cell wall biosynthesis